MLKKQKEIIKIMDNIQKETGKIDKILEEMGIEDEVEDKEVEDTEERVWKETEKAEERGIKKTMRHLKDTCCEMCLNKDDGYFIEEEELNEDDKDLIEQIKQM